MYQSAELATLIVRKTMGNAWGRTVAEIRSPQALTLRYIRGVFLPLNARFLVF